MSTRRRVRWIGAGGGHRWRTLGMAAAAMAQDEAPKLDSGNTAWMLTSSALVLMMTLPGPRALLRRPRPLEERALDLHAVHGVGGRRRPALDPGRLQPELRRGQRLRRRPREGRARGHRARHALGDLRHPRVRLRHVPGDVRDHHARADDRRLRRAHALRGPTSSSSRSGCWSSTARSRTWSGAAATSARRSARRTSPAASWCTCRAATRRSSRRSSSASAAASAASRCRRTTCPSR